MAASDSSRLVVSLVAHSRDVERFLELPQALFGRLSVLLAPSVGGGLSRPPARLQRDLRQALSLIATRVAGRGVTAAMRERGGPAEVQNSPFYKLIFVTQELTAANDGASAASAFELWQKAVSNCRKELALVRLGMETTGVSADLVLDLRSIELALMRMHGLAGSLLSMQHLSLGPFRLFRTVPWPPAIC